MSTLLLMHRIAYWPAAALLVAAAAALWAPSLRRGVAAWVLGAGLVAETVSACFRWAVTGHPPIFGTFENSIAASFAVGAVVLWMLWRGFDVTAPLLPRLLGLWIPVILGFGLFFPQVPYPLTISERSILVDVHVLFAWLAFAALLAAATAGAARLIDRDPSKADIYDDLMTRGIGLGFGLLSVMMVIGAIYSYMLFAEWYRWELVGVSCLAAWLGYGSALHARLMFAWQGRKLAWCALALLPLLLMTFWSWSLFTGTYHSFDINAIRAG